MSRLPSDLERLGDALTGAAHAAAASRERRERRRRVAVRAAAGALVFVALTPTVLGTAERSDSAAGLAAMVREKFAGPGCDGARATLPRCEPMILYRPYAVR